MGKVMGNKNFKASFVGFIPSVRRQIHNGVQFTYVFGNGFGASVVRHDHSYGSRVGLWEVAVLDRQGDLCYDSGITSDVLGCLTESGVFSVLARIAALDTAEAFI